MLDHKLAKIRVSSTGRISVIAVAAFLYIVWHRPAFSVEPVVADIETPHLQLAPIILSHKVGGLIDYTFRGDNYNNQRVSKRQGLGLEVFFDLNIKSFIWQPWLAEVGSTLHYRVRHNSYNVDMKHTYNTLNTYLNGDATLELVKYSRFPFKAKVYSWDHKNDAPYAETIGIQTTGYLLEQGYSTRNRKYEGHASFTSDITTGTGISAMYSDSFIFGMSMRPTPPHSLDIGFQALSRKQPSESLAWQNDNFDAHHLYQPNKVFSVASMFNTYQNSMTVSASAMKYDSSAVQFSSFASLRPETSPLTVTGSVRLFSTEGNDNGIVKPKQTSSDFNLGGNYLFSSLVRIYGSVNVYDSLGIQTVTTNEALIAQKPFATKDTTQIGGFRYSGSITGNISNISIRSTDNSGLTNARNSLSLGVNLSHELNKRTPVSSGFLMKNLHQSISSGLFERGIIMSNLNSGGYFAWLISEGKGSSRIRLGADDSRNVRGKSKVFQVINLDAERNEEITRNASLIGSLYFQFSKSHYEGLDSTKMVSSSAEINYRHNRAFKVLHLVFDSMLKVTNAHTMSTFEPIPYSATSEWNNSLSYYIGKTKMGAKFRVAKFKGIYQSSTYIYMNRPF